MSEPNPHKDRIHLVVRIARRDGAEVTPRHAAIVAKAATMFVAQAHLAEDHLVREPAIWARQGRALIGASHNLALRPMQPRSVAVWNRSPKLSSAERRPR